MLTRIGITGTDTGVGKTVVTTALVATLYARGVRVAPMKPVETGDGDDALRLRSACGDAYPLELIRPVALAEPLAPLVAARRAKTTVDLTTLDTAFTTLQQSSNLIVVEGAGGLLVPLTERESIATLFARWKLDLVVVTANRLGAVNHTRLTVACAQACGLTVRAVALNTVSDIPPGIAEATNEALLTELLAPVPVVRIPYAHRVAPDVSRLADLIHPHSEHAPTSDAGRH